MPAGPTQPTSTAGAEVPGSRGRHPPGLTCSSSRLGLLALCLQSSHGRCCRRNPCLLAEQGLHKGLRAAALRLMPGALPVPPLGTVHCRQLRCSCSWQLSRRAVPAPSLLVLLLLGAGAGGHRCRAGRKALE